MEIPKIPLNRKRLIFGLIIAIIAACWLYLMALNGRYMYVSMVGDDLILDKWTRTLYVNCGENKIMSVEERKEFFEAKNPPEGPITGFPSLEETRKKKAAMKPSAPSVAAPTDVAIDKFGFPDLADIRKKIAAGEAPASSIVAQTDTETVLMKEVREMNKKCPIMVNKETRIDNAILLSDNTFQINYTLFNWVKEAMDIETSKKLNESKAINIVNNSPMIKLLRDNKVTVVYHYSDKNGVFLFETVVTPNMYQN